MQHWEVCRKTKDTTKAKGVDLFLVRNIYFMMLKSLNNSCGVSRLFFGCVLMFGLLTDHCGLHVK